MARHKAGVRPEPKRLNRCHFLKVVAGAAGVPLSNAHNGLGGQTTANPLIDIKRQFRGLANPDADDHTLPIDQITHEQLGKPVQRQPGTAPTHSPELPRRRAHSRLYEALTTTFDQAALGNLFERMTPDIEAHALGAEQRRWGTGIGVVIEAFTGRRS